MKRWTDSDNLHGREALVVGGPHDGLRVVVNARAGRTEMMRYPDVIDLSDYVFDAETWTFRVAT